MILETYWLIATVAALCAAMVVIALGVMATLCGHWFDEWKNRPMTLTVIDRKEMADNLFHVSLAHPRFKSLPSFYPGQYITLHIPLSDNQTIRRAYSIANWEVHPNTYELGIKKEELGKGSSWLFEKLTTGTAIVAHRPKGEFIIKKNCTGPLVFVAAGIGITPVRAMLQQRINKADGQNTWLFYSCRTPNQLCYHSELEAMQQQNQSFRYIPTITGPAEQWNGKRGRIDIDTLRQHVPNLTDATFYLCAGAKMMDDLSHHLTARGVAQSQIVTENYGATSHTQSGSSFHINYQEQPVEFSNSPTLFQAIEDAGLEINGDCRSGNCGLCKCRLESGKVSYLIKPTYKLKNKEILPCCCVPKSDLVLQ